MRIGTDANLAFVRFTPDRKPRRIVLLNGKSLSFWPTEQEVSLAGNATACEVEHDDTTTTITCPTAEGSVRLHGAHTVVVNGKATTVPPAHAESHVLFRADGSVDFARMRM